MAEEEEEIWKEIPDYPDYKVSTFGRVKRIYKNGKEKLRKPQPTSADYLRVGLSKNNKNRIYRVHRLVALTFLPNYYGLPTVDHIDQNKENNSIYNLRWASHYTQSMNTCTTRTDILETDPKERKKIITKQSKQKTIDSKKYYCKTCNKAFDSNSALERHNTSKKHLTKEPIL